MSGRALKGARLAKGVLGRMRDRIKHGVQQPPAWYENVRRSPPAPLPRARAADVKRIVLPTDRLAQLYLRKRPDAAREGAPRDGHAQPTAVLFAQRQWELMRREGLSEDAAFARVEAELERERARALADLASLTRLARARLGARPALFADAAVARAHGEWSARLEELPYDDWDLGEQVALDHWIAEALLSWTWRESRRVVEAEFDAELSRLRTALFPAIPLSEEARIEEAAARRRDARAGGAGGEGAWAAVASALERDEGAADAWHAKLDALQARVDAKPYARWTADERDELDLWLLDEYCARNVDAGGAAGDDRAGGARGGGADAGLVDALARARAALFPELELGEAGEEGLSAGAQLLVARTAPTRRSRCCGGTARSRSEASRAPTTCARRVRARERHLARRAALPAARRLPEGARRRDPRGSAQGGVVHAPRRAARV